MFRLYDASIVIAAVNIRATQASARFCNVELAGPILYRRVVVAAVPCGRCPTYTDNPARSGVCATGWAKLAKWASTGLSALRERVVLPISISNHKSIYEVLIAVTIDLGL